MKTETEKPWRIALQKYRDRALTRRDLYRMLREDWGVSTFLGTRRCHENMKQRCRKQYAPLDPRFRSFPDFIHYLGPRPGREYSIDRIDGGLGYSPDNCRWSDKVDQSRNRRNTVYLTIKGERLPLVEWAARTGQRPHVLRARRKRGWSAEAIVFGAGAFEDLPLPPKTRTRFEAAFQRAGGGGHYERVSYLYRCLQERWAFLYSAIHFPERLSYQGEGADPPPPPIELWKEDFARISPWWEYAANELDRLNAEHELAFRSAHGRVPSDFDPEDL